MAERGDSGDVRLGALRAGAFDCFGARVVPFGAVSSAARCGVGSGVGSFLL